MLLSPAFFPLCLMLWSSSLFADQGGRVVVPSGRMFVSPDASSRVLVELPRGMHLRLINGDRKGWYRSQYQTSAGAIVSGWIRASDVKASGAPPKFKPSPSSATAQGLSAPKPMPSSSANDAGAPQTEPKSEIPLESGLPALDLASAFVLSAGYHALANAYFLQVGYRFTPTWSLFVFTSPASKTGLDYKAEGQIWAGAVRATPIRTQGYRLGFQLAAGTIPDLGVRLANSTVYYSPSVFVTEAFHQIVLSEVFHLRFGLGYRFIQPIEAKSGGARVQTRMNSTFILLGVDLEF